MIRRRNIPSTIIPQTAHGWLAGQLAAHWGNNRFQHPGDPRELMLAAANHDQGWVQWEQSPRINADGRPTDFLEMPVAEHVKIWRQSIADVNSQSRYGALLVSRHARFLNEMRLNAANDSADDLARLRDFCTTQSTWEERVLAELHNSPYYAPLCGETRLSAAFRLLQVFDWLSLLLSMEAVSEAVVTDVPERWPDERISITMKTIAENVLTVMPWPFDVPAFSVAVQAKELPAETFADDAEFQTIWQATPFSTWVFTFRAEHD